MRRLGLALVLLLLAAAPAGAANRWIQKDAPLNIAHQGGEDEFPSNTLYAFRKAVRAGADMLELDIGVTKDGKVIVMHDTTVDGKTNGHGTVASKTLRQVKRLDAAFWFAPAASEGTRWWTATDRWWATRRSWREGSSDTSATAGLKTACTRSVPSILVKRVGANCIDQSR